MTKERIVLAVVIQTARSAWTPDDETKEMTELIAACGGEVVLTVLCKTIPPTATYLLTTGKVAEIKSLCMVEKVDCVVIGSDLKGSQQRNLESEFGVKTIDRTQVILDIFARRAKSMEGKMQVELAQLQYLLPRLSGHGQEMSQTGGGIGTSGPGETKLETDRRRIADRITRLRRDLKEVTQSRQIKRKKRKGHDVPNIAMVGYTNAGKSTLMNALTQAGTLSHNSLFTTLDSLSRQASLPNNREVVFSDTVGFIHNLPHGIIEAFKATLEEVQDADVLVHVLDISHPNFRNLYQAVNAVLEELKVMDKPTILALNKIDQLEDHARLKEFKKANPHAVGISALKGEGMGELLVMIEGTLGQGTVDIDLIINAKRMDLVHLAHRSGQVHEVKYLSKGIRLKAALPAQTAAVITREAGNLH